MPRRSPDASRLGPFDRAGRGGWPRSFPSSVRSACRHAAPDRATVAVMSTSEADPASQASGEGSGQPVREPGPAGPVPIEGIDARLVANMTASLGIPTATSFRAIPVDVLAARREQLNAALAPARLSLTHLIAYAVAQAALSCSRRATRTSTG